MLNTILIVLRTISLIFGGHEQVALENLALREQLGIFQRSVRHPKIRQRDRLFWVCLQKVWKEWRSALVIVRPETVLDWQRKHFKRTGANYPSTRIQVDLGGALISENW